MDAGKKSGAELAIVDADPEDWPEGIRMLAGGASTFGFELAKLTNTPEAGAGAERFTCTGTVSPGATEAGAVTETSGSGGVVGVTPRVAATAVRSAKAMRLTLAALARKYAPFTGTLNNALGWPGGKVMAPGAATSAGLSLVNVMVTPAGPAGAPRVTTPVTVSPGAGLEGERVNA